MKHTFKGWAVGLTDTEKKIWFLGPHETSDGDKDWWCGGIYRSPCVPNVYENLFNTSGEALSFYKKCIFDPLYDKEDFTPIAVKVELSVEVKGLGFEWNGLS